MNASLLLPHPSFPTLCRHTLAKQKALHTTASTRAAALQHKARRPPPCGSAVGPAVSTPRHSHTLRCLRSSSSTPRASGCSSASEISRTCASPSEEPHCPAAVRASMRARAAKSLEYATRTWSGQGGKAASRSG
eukprot:360469-Chlamydomonas_euryale.AAC.8